MTNEEKLTLECRRMCDYYLDDDYENAAGMAGNLRQWVFKYGCVPDLSQLSESETRALILLACYGAAEMCNEDETNVSD